MLAADVCDNALGRLKDPAEVRKLSEMIRADLKHRNLVSPCQAEEHLRNADMVVEVPGGAQDCILAPEHGGNHFLRRGFAVAAGYGDKGYEKLAAENPRQPTHGVCRIP